VRILVTGLLSGALLLHGASFEAATIKPAVPDAYGSSGEDGRNGVLRMWNVSLKRCIRYAYAVPEGQIVGGPKWIDERRYDILAKADQAATEPELLKMLQPLLADRFRLALHRENRNVQGYTLRVAKGGIKATVSDPERHSGGDGGRGRIECVACKWPSLAIRLSALLGRPVVDMTGDTRMFDYHLTWSPDDAPADSVNADRPSLFTALEEQLGVKLESGKVNAEVLVVDRAEFPLEN
jgi:uncharacterized protein (TIGR03435 family)